MNNYTNPSAALVLRSLNGGPLAMTDTLKPCPFCGNAAAFARVTYSANSDDARLNGQREFHYVNCPLCGANNQGIIGSKTQEIAAEKWNRRATPNAGGAPDLDWNAINEGLSGVRAFVQSQHVAPLLTDVKVLQHRLAMAVDHLGWMLSITSRIASGISTTPKSTPTGRADGSNG